MRFSIGGCAYVEPIAYRFFPLAMVTMGLSFSRKKSMSLVMTFFSIMKSNCFLPERAS